MTTSFIIHGELPTLNAYIQAERGNKYAGAKIKKDATELCAWCCKSIPIIDKYPIDITIQWYTKDIKIDPDNLAFGIKFILDGMVKAGKIVNDGRKQIASISHEYYLDKDIPRIRVFVENKENT